MSKGVELVRRIRAIVDAISPGTADNSRWSTVTPLLRRASALVIVRDCQLIRIVTNRSTAFGIAYSLARREVSVLK